MQSVPQTNQLIGSLDGNGAGDNHQPYSFGRRPRSASPFPFTPRQYMRLLMLRSRLEALGTTTPGSGTTFGHEHAVDQRGS